VDARHAFLKRTLSSTFRSTANRRDYYQQLLSISIEKNLREASPIPKSLIFNTSINNCPLPLDHLNSLLLQKSEKASFEAFSST